MIKLSKEGKNTGLGDALARKKFFEQQIEANKPPPKPKKEKFWTPNANQNLGAHSTEGFTKQTKLKTVLPKPSGPPPPKKDIYK